MPHDHRCEGCEAIDLTVEECEWDVLYIALCRRCQRQLHVPPLAAWRPEERPDNGFVPEVRGGSGLDRLPLGHAEDMEPAWRIESDPAA